MERRRRPEAAAGRNQSFRLGFLGHGRDGGALRPIEAADILAGDIRGRPAVTITAARHSLISSTLCPRIRSELRYRFCLSQLHFWPPGLSAIPKSEADPPFGRRGWTGRCGRSMPFVGDHKGALTHCQDERAGRCGRCGR